MSRVLATVSDDLKRDIKSDPKELKDTFDRNLRSKLPEMALPSLWPRRPFLCILFRASKGWAPVAKGRDARWEITINWVHRHSRRMRESAAPPAGPVCSRIRGFQEQELNNNSSTPAPDRLHHRLKNEFVREYSSLQLSSWRGRLSFATRNVLGDILAVRFSRISN